MPKYQVEVDYYQPGLGIQQRLVPVTLPYNARIEQVYIRPEDTDIIQVKFTHRGRPYHYRCKGAKVGDWVIVPPNRVCPNRQIVQVVGLGGHNHSGRYVEAQLITKGMLGDC